jgi:hypothetical protein
MKLASPAINVSLRGLCHEIFDFRFFFHESVSSRSLSIPHRAVSNFFENSQRYSQLKVHQQSDNIPLFATSVVDTGGKFATGIINTSGTSVIKTSGAPYEPCEYFCEMLKKFEMTLMLFSGAWGKMIHEKNLKQKILQHCPFNTSASEMGGNWSRLSLSASCSRPLRIARIATPAEVVQGIATFSLSFIGAVSDSLHPQNPHLKYFSLLLQPSVPAINEPKSSLSRLEQPHISQSVVVQF